MADNHDGSIVIDTKLDNKDFEKGSEALLAAIKSLTRQIELLGKTIQSSFAGCERNIVSVTRSMTGTHKAADDIGKDINRLGKDIDRMSSQAEKAINGDKKAMQGFEENASKTAEGILGLKQRLEAFGNTKIETEAYKEVKDNIRKAEQTLEKLIDKQEKLRAIGTAANSKAWKSLQYDIEQTRGELRGYHEDLEFMKEGKGGTQFVNASDTEEFKRMSEAVAELEARLVSLKNTAPVRVSPEPVEVSSASSAAQITEIPKAEVPDTAPISAGTEELKEMLTLSDRLKNALGSAFGAIKSGVTNAVTHPAQTAGKALKALASGAVRALGQGLISVAGAAKKALSGMLRLAGNAVKSGLSAVAGKVRNTAGALLGLSHSGKSANNSLKSGLKTILKYGLGIRSLFVLFRKIRSAIKEGFGSLAQVSPEVNSAISSMMTALGRLKNSLTAAFAPIATAVAPALTYLMDLLSDAITRVGMFIAALTGQTTFTRAVAVQQDYASSVDDTTKKLKEQKKVLAGFDKLEILTDSSSSDSKKTDPSDMFEDVQISSGMLDYIGRIKEMFSKGDYESIGKTVASGINKALAKVNSLISWDKIGGTITKYVNSFCQIFNGFVDGIKWGQIGTVISNGINTILNTFNLLLTGIKWDELGKKLSEALTKLVKGINWKLLGETLGNYFSAKLKFITSAIINFDWKGAGTEIAKGINSLVSKLKSTIQNVKWKDMAKNFTSGINSLISNVNWNELGAFLGDSFNALLDTINGIVTEFDWKGAGESLGASVNSMASEIKWDELGETIGETLKGVLGGLTTFIEEVDWKALGQDIFTALSNINWGGVIAAVREGIGAALGGLAGFIWGLIKGAWEKVVGWWKNNAFKDGKFTIQGLLNGIVEGLKNIGSWIWNNIFKPFIDGFKKAFGINSPSKKMEDQGGFVIKGFFQGIINAIVGIGTWIKEHIFDPFINGFKSVFGIHSPSKEMETQGGFIISGLLNGIINGLKNIVGWVGEHILKPIRDAIVAAGGLVVDVVTNLVKGEWGILTSLAETGTKVVTNLAKGAWGILTSLAETGTKVVTNLAKGAWGILDALATVGRTVLTNLAKGSWWILDALATTGRKVVTNLAKGAWGILTSLAETGTKVVTNLAKGAWGILTSLAETGTKVVTNLAKGAWNIITNLVNNGISVAVNLLKGVAEGAKGVWTTLKAWIGGAIDVAINLIKGVAQGVKGAWTTIKNFVGGAVDVAINLVKGVAEGAKGVWTTLKSWIGGAVDVVVNLAKGVAEGVKGAWTTLTSWIGDVVDVFVNLHKGDISDELLQIGDLGIEIFKSGKSGTGKERANGGIITPTGIKDIPQYAGGTANAHGTMFIAGEAGPEIVGHIGGRTEVLNRSQLAATMYSAVTSGMAAVMNGFGSALFGRMSAAADAIVNAVGAGQPVTDVSHIPGLPALMSELSRLTERAAFSAPVMAGGTVVPYSASGGISSGRDITDTIESAGSELSDILVSAIAQAAAIVAGAVRDKDMTVKVDADSISRYTIDDINRRTTVFRASPLKG